MLQSCRPFCFLAAAFSTLLPAASIGAATAGTTPPAKDSGLTAQLEIGALAAALVVPATAVRPVVDELHGAQVPDPYRWLEDRTTADTELWIQAQNAYRHSYVHALPPFEGLQQDLVALLDYDSWGLPRGGDASVVYSKRSAGQSLSALYARSPGAPERLLVDPASLQGEAVTVGVWDLSANGELLAYWVSERGEDEVRIEIIAVANGERKLTLPKRDYLGGGFAADGRSLWYAESSASGPIVTRREIGSAKETHLEAPPLEPGNRLRLLISDDRRQLLFKISHGAGAQRSDLHVADAVGDTTRVRPLVVGIDAVFDPRFGGGELYVRTNWRHPNYSLFRIDLADPRPEKWTELAPGSDAVITDFLPVARKIVVSELRRLAPALSLVDPASGVRRDVPLPTVGTVGALGGEWDGKSFFLSFSSYAQPPSILRVDAENLERTVWAEPHLDLDLSGLETTLRWYPSKDGTEVPLFITHAKGIELDGSRPTFLVGYGGFGEVELPAYSTRAAYWALRGGVWAYAGVRGGGELGSGWHRSGILERKQSSYDDFIGAAEWLVAHGYTRPDRLAIGGGSNGGLMALAVAMQRPELFRFVLAYSPLTDMLRYHRFLKAARWIPEYGSADNAAQFPYLLAYSPYQNVRIGRPYPAMLVVTGDGDTRVDPLHSRKMVAALQAESPRATLLRYDSDTGHGGESSVEKDLEDLLEEMRLLKFELCGSAARCLGAAAAEPDTRPGN